MNEWMNECLVKPCEKSMFGTPSPSPPVAWTLGVASVVACSITDYFNVWQPGNSDLYILCNSTVQDHCDACFGLLDWKLQMCSEEITAVLHIVHDCRSRSTSLCDKLRLLHHQVVKISPRGNTGTCQTWVYLPDIAILWTRCLWRNHLILSQSVELTLEGVNSSGLDCYLW